jgi:hypothetical protein
MSKRGIMAGVWLAMLLGISVDVCAQGAPGTSAGTAGSAPPPTGAQTPPAPQPKETPPPPASASPPPPQAQPIEPARAAAPAPAVPAPAPLPPGQWVYTRQYGWLWMPYARVYTHVDADAALAYTYVYYPAFGWRWVVAPWVLGFGFAPYWGPLGPAPFAWYARPWFRIGVPYYPYRGPGWRPPPAARGFRSAPRR